MFPLGRPCLPGEVLPLRIFESRYVAMLDALSRSDEAHFGVVMIDRGSEIGGGDVRRSIGTKMIVARVEEMPVKHFAVIAIGLERIRVVEWLQDAPFPRALIESWPDTNDPVPVTSSNSKIRLALDSEALRHVPPDQRVYSLSSALPIGPLDAQRILEERNALRRENILGEVLVHLEELARFSDPSND